MIEYILILLSVVCFAAQFAFTKLYEGAVGQSTSTSLVMLVGTSLVGAVLFFSVNGFRINFSPVSVAWAVCFAEYLWHFWCRCQYLFFLKTDL